MDEDYGLRYLTLEGPGSGAWVAIKIRNCIQCRITTNRRETNAEKSPDEGSDSVTNAPFLSNKIAAVRPVRDPWSLCHPHQEEKSSSIFTACLCTDPAATIEGEYSTFSFSTS